MNGRDRQILRAVLIGRAVLDCGCLRIDGCWCSDQIAARRLVDNGLIAPAVPGRPGMTVLAVLTDAGRRELDGTAVAA